MSTLSMAAFKTAARFSREWKRPCPKIRTRTPRPLRPTPRPHELDIERSPRNERSLPATVRHVNPAGAVAKIEVVLRDQETVVQANLSRETVPRATAAPGRRGLRRPTAAADIYCIASEF